jgi:hypothetical protein
MTCFCRLIFCLCKARSGTVSACQGGLWLLHSTHARTYLCTLDGRRASITLPHKKPHMNLRARLLGTSCCSERYAARTRILVFSSWPPKPPPNRHRANTNGIGNVGSQDWLGAAATASRVCARRNRGTETRRLLCAIWTCTRVWLAKHQACPEHCVGPFPRPISSLCDDLGMMCTSSAYVLQLRCTSRRSGRVGDHDGLQLLSLV